MFVDRENTGQWQVEWFDDNGTSEVEIFTRPETRQQAPQGRTGVFRRHVGDGEHAEVVSGERVYRVRAADLL